MFYLQQSWKTIIRHAATGACHGTPSLAGCCIQWTQGPGTQGPESVYTVRVHVSLIARLEYRLVMNYGMDYPYKPCVRYLLDCFTEYSLTHSSCVAHAFVLYVSHSVAWDSDDGHMRATALCFVCVFAHTHPTMFYIHLVKYASDLWPLRLQGGCMNSAPLQDRVGYEWVTR